MLEFIRSAALIWMGACIRNKEDRDTTIKFFNGIGGQAEKILKDFLPKGGAVDVSEKTAQTDQYS